MKSKGVIFIGKGKDENGIPVPYHVYHIIASKNDKMNKVVVSVLPLANGTPPLEERHHFFDENEDVENAIGVLIKKIESMKENKDLLKRM